MKINTLPLSTYLDEIRDGHPFSFVRYGDGEWACMRGHTGRNCDGNAYTPELRAALVESLVTAPLGTYHTGMQPMALRLWGATIHRWLAFRNIARPWHNADFLHRANAAGKLWPLFNLLNRSPSVLVGPEYLGTVKISFDHHVLTPRKNAENEAARIVREIADHGAGAVVCCCLGPCAAPVIRAAYDLIGADAWLLDIGSILDPYVQHGRRRRYFGKISRTIRAANFGKVTT